MSAADHGLLTIRAGNGTVEAASQLGWTHIAATIVAEGDAAAQAFALVDNRAGELAEWDIPVLGATMQALEADGVDLQGLGWSDFEIDGLLDLELDPTDLGDDDDPTGNLGGGSASPGTERKSVTFTPEQWAVCERSIDRLKSQVDGAEPMGVAEAMAIVMKAWLDGKPRAKRAK